MSKHKTVFNLISSSYTQSLRKHLPKIDENYYWGPGSQPKRIDGSIRPFKVQVNDEILDDLKSRLKNTRKMIPPLEGIKQEYGFNSNLLQKVVKYWLEDYNWRERETHLNQFPQFKTNIQGLDIHYLHVKPTDLRDGVETYPLLIVHGWPGSVKEFYKIIPFLTKPMKGRNFAFEVIAPSIPGYAFSDPAAKPGFGVLQTAAVFKSLMQKLGFNKYYLQGGDWGSQITTNLATLYPEHVLGLHINLCVSLMPITMKKIILGSIWPSLIVNSKKRPLIYPLVDRFFKLLKETGYYHIQATKPDTVGAALSDSPAGLAAYILEKFSTGTNPKYKGREDGGLLEKFTYDDLLDNVMLYWITNSATTAARLYAEIYHPENVKLRMDRYPLSKKTPVALLKAPYEMAYLPDNLLVDRYPNIVQSREISKGGHFLAMEEPEILAEDLFYAVETMRKSH